MWHLRSKFDIKISLIIEPFRMTIWRSQIWTLLNWKHKKSTTFCLKYWTKDDILIGNMHFILFNVKYMKISHDLWIKLFRGPFTKTSDFFIRILLLEMQGRVERQAHFFCRNYYIQFPWEVHHVQRNLKKTQNSLEPQSICIENM